MTEETQHSPTYKERSSFGASSWTYRCSCKRGYSSTYRSQEAAEEAFAKHVESEREREELEANPKVLEEPCYFEISTGSGPFGLLCPTVQLVLMPDGTVTWQKISTAGAAPLVPKREETS